MKKNRMPATPVAPAPHADRIAIDLAMPRVAVNVRTLLRQRDPQYSSQT